MRSSGMHTPKPVVALLVLLLIAVLGIGIQRLPGDWSLTTVSKQVAQPEVTPRLDEGILGIDPSRWELTSPGGVSKGELATHAETQRVQQAKILFEHAVLLQQQGQSSRAVAALEMVITLLPQMPEAYVNLGFSLYDLGEFDAARGAFGRAIELNPAQGNAYYGLAIVYEAQQELELALGAMRSFLHIADAQERYKVRARAAIWEWENMLGRGGSSDASRVSDGVSVPVPGVKN